MAIESVHHTNPAGVWGCPYRPLAGRCKLLCRPRWTDGRRQKLPGGDLKMGPAGLGPMPAIFLCRSFHHVWPHGTCGRRPLQRLYPGLLLCADPMAPLALQGLGLGIQRAHGPPVSIALLGGLRALIVEPVSPRMRLSSRFFLQSVRRCGWTCCRQGRVCAPPRLTRGASRGTPAVRRPPGSRTPQLPGDRAVRA